MANPFVEGMESATAVSQARNPFNVILSRINEAQARRMKEDSERRKEEAELKNALSLLYQKDVYEKELQKAKAEEDRKTELVQGLTQGRIQETQGRQVTEVMGKPVFEAQTAQGVPGAFEGTPFGAVGKYYKARETQATPVYLVDPVTGNLKQIASTEKGAKVIQQPKMTEAEQNIAKAQDRMSGFLDEYKQLIQDKEIIGSEKRKVIAGKRIPFGYFFTGGKTERLKNAIDNLKADIPFSRGGKQLTREEAARVDVLLDPSGKDLQTIMRNVEAFEKEFLFGSELASKGRIALQQGGQGEISEEDIQYTMQKHGLSRGEVLRRIGR